MPSILQNPHIVALGKTTVDLVIWDGASNVQNAGQELQLDFPWMTCIRGAEHQSSLWLGDTAKTYHVKLIIQVYRRVYHWFGGTVRALFAVFKTTSQINNCYSGKPLMLIKACDL